MRNHSETNVVALGILEDKNLITPSHYHRTTYVAAPGQPTRYVMVEIFMDKSKQVRYPLHYFLVDTVLQNVYYASFLLPPKKMIELAQAEQEAPVR